MCFPVLKKWSQGGIEQWDSLVKAQFHFCMGGLHCINYYPHCVSKFANVLKPWLPRNPNTSACTEVFRFQPRWTFHISIDLKHSQCNWFTNSHICQGHHDESQSLVSPLARSKSRPICSITRLNSNWRTVTIALILEIESSCCTGSLVAIPKP